ncbi:MAG: DUF1501 domain-containing protein [Planctomycetaceae bacterium]
MPSSTPEAGDLAGEAEATQALCGIDDPEERSAALACMCLVARRLVKRGVRFVRVDLLPDKEGWDAHGDLIGNPGPRALWTVGRPAASFPT